MAKVAIALKVDPETHAELKQRAETQNKTLSDLLQEGLFVTQKIQVLESKMDDMTRQNEEMRRQLERVNRKPIIKKRVSIPLSLQEYDNLSKIAFEQKRSKSAVLRSLLIKDPQLTVNG